MAISAADPEHVELQNVSGGPIDVEGWSFVDNAGKGARPNRFTLERSEHNPGPYVLQDDQTAIFWFSPLWVGGKMRTVQCSSVQ